MQSPHPQAPLDYERGENGGDERGRWRAFPVSFTLGEYLQ